MKRRSEAPAEGKADIMLLGLGRFGAAIARKLREDGLRLFCVDFEPEAVLRWRRRGFDTVYGDVSDPEIVAALPLSEARCAVSAIRSHAGGLIHDDHRLALMAALQGQHFGGRVAVTLHLETEVELLRGRGAHLVLLPFQDAAPRAAELLVLMAPVDVTPDVRATTPAGHSPTTSNQEEPSCPKP